MAGLVSNLIQTLRGQTDLFNEVVALSAHKKEHIIKNDVEKLREVVKQENIIVPKALSLDKEREKIMANIAIVLNKKQEDLTLSLLSELTQGQPEHAEFVAVVDDFKLALEAMKTANDHNKALIEDALDFVEFNMNIIHSSLDAAPAGYGSLEDGHEPGSFIDTRS
ncbi:MAG: flagellar protein FlgN [Defluviitaleaceae bacterium]|nr:flagellar protein FlgN [Defluviitaleaceae bacterium]